MTVVDVSEQVFPRHRLANGLQIVAQPMEGVESVALGYTVLAGAGNERPSEAGISHFVESMAFQGTQTRSVQELTEAFEDIGANTGSAASSEFSSYSSSLLGRNLAPALELLTDVVLHPGFVEDELPKARDRILQEIAQLEDEPMRKVLDLLRREYFRGHPLGNETIGTTETVAALTRSDLRDYWARQYGAGNVLFSVAGKFDFDAVVRQIEDLCRDWPAGETASLPPAPVPERHATVLHKESTQQHIGIAVPGVGATSPDYYAVALMVATLGGSMNSRLFMEVREKRRRLLHPAQGRGHDPGLRRDDAREGRPDGGRGAGRAGQAGRGRRDGGRVTPGQDLAQEQGHHGQREHRGAARSHRLRLALRAAYPYA